MNWRRILTAAAAVTTVVGMGLVLPPTNASAIPEKDGSGPLSKFKNIVVIYEENHSFDNLYGGWGAVGGKSVEGLSDADAAHTIQVKQDGSPYNCLLQNDVNLTPDQVPPICADSANGVAISSAFVNAPFTIDDYIKPTDTTCPQPGDFTHPTGILKGTGLPGGCTRDLVHRFYQEQYQLNGGLQNRYVTGSDAVGLTMGQYDTKALPIYRYLHGKHAPNYVIADHFFQGAYGGSYLNHQWLISATAPQWPTAPATEHAVLDSNGFPRTAPAYPLYVTPQPATTHDGTVTQECGLATTIPGRACGNNTINTLLPSWEPTAGYAPKVPGFTNSTIGDQLSDAGVSWAWYSGGWDNAAGNVGGPGYTNGAGPTCADPRAASPTTYPYCPDKTFQQHHQPFNYYTRYAPGTPDRAAHLKDEKEFIARAQSGGLPKVSFVKPVGAENEHPGYASENSGSTHLVDLIKAIQGGPQATDTLIVVTYDEFGGQWDHVSPPGQGNNNAAHDLWGPGTRLPTLLIGEGLHVSTVDHTSLDSTSILATIERQYGLPPLSSRAAAVNDLGPAIRAGHDRRD
ncbi:MAG: phosphoesterase [Actinomycetota bacterium]|nr:phosphoesterase [Actinomycetota bacterium]